MILYMPSPIILVRYASFNHGPIAHLAGQLDDQACNRQLPPQFVAFSFDGLWIDPGGVTA